LLHLSWIFIISGAFVTRYISYGHDARKNVSIPDKTFLTVFWMGIIKVIWTKSFEKPLLLSPATNNSFSISDKFADTSFEVEFEEFIMGAKEYVKQILLEFYT
jgi:hypothetical protein